MIEMVVGVMFMAVFFVGLFVLLFDRAPVPGSKKWEDDWESGWFQRNKYCEICGKSLIWLEQPGFRYDSGNGLKVMTQVWSCPDDKPLHRHTFYSMVPWCRRETQVNG